MRAILLVILFVLPLSSGCAKAPEMSRAKVGMAKDGAMPRNEAPRPPGAAEQDQAGGQVAHHDPQDPPAKGEKEPKADQPRKIKYTADMRVIVEDFDKSWETLKGIIKDAKAIRSQEEVNSSPGSQRTGVWRLRVPVERFDNFRDAIVKLGDVEVNKLLSEDITAEYYDLDAHIKNKQSEREAIRKLVEKTGDRDLQQFFIVKRELDSINDYINRKEGTLRLWGNLTDLTTVTLNMRERGKWEPEKKPTDKPADPDFGTRASTTWTASTDLFTGFLQSVAIVAIAVTPWLPVPLVLALLLWLAVKLLVRLTRAPVVVAVVEKPAKKTEV